MLEVTLRGVTGTEWLLTGSEQSSAVLAPEEALVSLVGQASWSDVSIPGRAGVIPGRMTFGAIEAEVPFYLHADNGEEMEKLYRDFRRAWSPAQPTQIEVLADHPLGALTFDAFLRSPIRGTPVDMRRRTSATVPVSVFVPSGLARSRALTSTGVVTVTNVGDVAVYPKIVYSGEGGEVTGPSGATFMLPPAAHSETVDLDPAKLRVAGAFPEGVPPGQTGQWRLPEGAKAVWEVLVADPWA